MKALKKLSSWQKRIRPLIGNYGEYIALKSLKKKKFVILEKNWKLKWGEIDIIALDKDELVFIEVKTRLAVLYNEFNAADAVDAKKIRKIKKLADIYLDRKEKLINRLKLRSIRYDVIGVTLYSVMSYEIEHRVDAFE